MSQKRPRSVAKVRGDAEKDAKEHDMNTEHDFPVIEVPERFLVLLFSAQKKNSNSGSSAAGSA
jgi:hypothetical protein